MILAMQKNKSATLLFNDGNEPIRNSNWIPNCVFVWANQSGCAGAILAERMFYFLFVVVFFSFFDPLKYRTLDLNSLVDCRLRLFHYTARTTVKINFLCGGKVKSHQGNSIVFGRATRVAPNNVMPICALLWAPVSELNTTTPDINFYFRLATLKVYHWNDYRTSYLNLGRNRMAMLLSPSKWGAS